MKHVGNLVTTAEALQKVFLPSLRQSRPLLWQRPHSSPALIFHQRRHLIFSGGRTVKTASSFGPKNGQKGPPRDEDIRSHEVRIVGPTGALKDPEALYHVLRSIDRSKSFVIQVSPQDGIGIPVCKVMDKEQFRKAEKAKSKPTKSVQSTTKQLELGWAIGPNDLGHRLNKMQQFLEEGRRVEIVISTKRRARKVTDQEAEWVLGRIRERIGKIDGAKEWKAMAGSVEETATLYVEGKARKAVEKETG